MVNLTVSPQSAVFRVGGVDVGTYVLDDPYKPYLHPLRTPAGHVVSLAKPYDHRHHKGLMYAIATEEVNFWEEEGDERYPRIGRQQQVGIEFDFSVGHPEVRQDLSWVDDLDAEIFHESRTIGCELLDSTTIRWTWASRIESMRTQRLRMSPWSMPDESGRLVNYHGLGLRFPRSFSGRPQRMQVRTDAGESTVAAVHGRVLPAVEVRGVIDGTWPAPTAGVSIRQLDTQHQFFLLSDTFVSLSTGPSVAGPVDLSAGDVFSQTYQIDVSDFPEAD